jgi:hypothetical protein
MRKAWDTATLDTANSFAIAKCSGAGNLTVKANVSDDVDLYLPIKNRAGMTRAWYR